MFVSGSGGVCHLKPLLSPEVRAGTSAEKVISLQTLPRRQKQRLDQTQGRCSQARLFLPHNPGLVSGSLQVITEHESKLAAQNKLISELQETVSQLQTEARSNRYHIRTQQRQEEAARREVKTLQHKELQTRVALELITSKVSAASASASSLPPWDAPTITSKEHESTEAFCLGRSTKGDASGHCSPGCPPQPRGQRSRKLIHFLPSFVAFNSYITYKANRPQIPEALEKLEFRAVTSPGF